MHDLYASAPSKELKVEKVECDMCQGDKLGASAVRELPRSKDKVKLLIIPVASILQYLNWNRTDLILLSLGNN